MSKKMSRSEVGKLGFQASKKIHEESYVNRQKSYLNNPTLCSFCSEALPYTKRRNKYCNSSCSAKSRNKRRVYKKFHKPKFCLNCGISVPTRNLYCSNVCHQAYKWEYLKAETIIHPMKATPRNLKRVLLEDRGSICENCGNTEWMGFPIPLDLDHINGNPFDHHFSNLRLLCLNCHGLTSTFKAKNKGKGRKSRSNCK